MRHGVEREGWRRRWHRTALGCWSIWRGERFSGASVCVWPRVGLIELSRFEGGETRRRARFLDGEARRVDLLVCVVVERLELLGLARAAIARVELQRRRLLEEELEELGCEHAIQR